MHLSINVWRELIQKPRIYVAIFLCVYRMMKQQEWIHALNCREVSVCDTCGIAVSVVAEHGLVSGAI